MAKFIVGHDATIEYNGVKIAGITEIPDLSDCTLPYYLRKMSIQIGGPWEPTPEDIQRFFDLGIIQIDPNWYE